MIVKESLLKFDNFAVLDTICHYNHGEELSNDHLYSYPVDVDFDILSHKNENIFKIIVSVRINSERKSGYTISVLAATFFRIAGEITEQEKINLLQYSGVQMAIANLRSYIESITSYYPLGKYILPTFDLQDLINRKSEMLAANQE